VPERAIDSLCGLTTSFSKSTLVFSMAFLAMFSSNLGSPGLSYLSFSIWIKISFFYFSLSCLAISSISSGSTYLYIGTGASSSDSWLSSNSLMLLYAAWLSIKFSSFSCTEEFSGLSSIENYGCLSTYVRTSPTILAPQLGLNSSSLKLSSSQWSEKKLSWTMYPLCPDG